MDEVSRADGRALMGRARKDLEKRLEQLAFSVDQVAADEGFRSLLRGMSKLWRYGSFNRYLIHDARPDATAVAGRRQWERMGRTVREGEEPIWILAPRGGQGAGFPFVIVDVFDISQTDGPPPPPIGNLCKPGGECERLPDIEAAAERLRIQVSDVSAFPEGYAPDTPTLGTALPSKRTVRVRMGLSPLKRAAILVHEYAHVLLLQPQRRRGKDEAPKFERPDPVVSEAEADAVAFVVLDALGLPSNAPTYIAWMGGRGHMLMASMGRIQAAVRAILLAIEGKTPKVRIPRLPKVEKVVRVHRAKRKSGRKDPQVRVGGKKSRPGARRPRKKVSKKQKLARQ